MKTLILSAITLLLFVNAAQAESNYYFKLGVSGYEEKLGSETPAKDQSITQEIGFQHKSEYDGLETEQSIGICLAEGNFEGKKLETGDTRYDLSSATVGLRAYVGAGVPIIVNDSFSMVTDVGLGVNTFARYAASDYWWILSTKTGLGFKYGRTELKAGVQYPLSTTRTINMTSANVSNYVTVAPKGKLTPYADILIKVSDSLKIGIYAEIQRWTASDTTLYSTANASPTAAQSKYNQPDTTIINSGFRFEYAL